MENKIIDYMEIYRGGESGCKPMVKITFMSNGIKQSPIDLPWDEPQVREKEILPYLNGYTLINDTRVIWDLR